MKTGSGISKEEDNQFREEAINIRIIMAQSFDNLAVKSNQLSLGHLFKQYCTEQCFNFERDGC